MRRRCTGPGGGESQPGPLNPLPYRAMHVSKAYVSILRNKPLLVIFHLEDCPHSARESLSSVLVVKCNVKSSSCLNMSSVGVLESDVKGIRMLGLKPFKQ